MAFTDWSATPILNADVPGASFHDLPQTSGVWAVGIRQIMADLVTALARGIVTVTGLRYDLAGDPRASTNDAAGCYA